METFFSGTSLLTLGQKKAVVGRQANGVLHLKKEKKHKKKKGFSALHHPNSQSAQRKKKKLETLFRHFFLEWNKREEKQIIFSFLHLFVFTKGGHWL